MSIIIAAAALLFAVDQPPRRYLGETYTCDFAKAGRVTIDTREPGSTLTIRGRTRPARGGSYWYVTDDDQMEMVMFGPNMSRWSYGEHGEPASKCTKRINRR